MAEFSPNLWLTNSNNKRAFDVAESQSTKLYIEYLQGKESLLLKRRAKVKKRLIIRDITNGKEKLPIPVYNEVDDVIKVEEFKYMTRLDFQKSFFSYIWFSLETVGIFPALSKWRPTFSFDFIKSNHETNHVVVSKLIG